MAVTRIERRIMAEWGVNRMGFEGFDTYEGLQRQAERETMGPVTVTSRSSREVTYGDWTEDEPE